MQTRKLAIDFLTFQEDTTYTITRENLLNYYNEKDEDAGELSPGSLPQKIRFEFGNNVIISTHQIPDGTTFRYIYEGKFSYSKNLALNNLKFKEGYAVFHNAKKEEEYGWRTKLNKGVSGNPKSLIEFENLTNKLFNENKISDEYDIYQGKYETIKGQGEKNITKGKHARYFKDGWQDIAFEENLITGNSIEDTNKQNDETEIPGSISNNSNQRPHEYVIKSTGKFNKKSLTRIKKFDKLYDFISIDAASFGIDNIINSPIMEKAKGKKELNALARKDCDFLYDQKKGGLYFNENGADKGFGEGGIVAILKGAPDLTASNLEFI